jgi:hypothetical protein
MAIKDTFGRKVTPKQKAQDLLLHSMVTALYALNDDPRLTDHEREKVLDQLNKQKARVEKMFGYEPGSWSWA